MFADNSIKGVQDYFSSKLQDDFSKRDITLFCNYALEVEFNLSKSDLILNAKKFSESELLWFRSVVKRLLENEPIQYILGKTHFYGYDFKVDKRVLIPRPETEELVDIIVKDNPKGTLLDIGTGSGVIPISVQLACPSINCSAIDISTDALQVATENAVQHSCQIEFIQKDILIDNLGDTMYDIIVSNPPYVLNSDKKEMQLNVLNFEPSLALFVEDSNPLIFYSRIIELSSNLNEGGKMYFEIHERFGDEILGLFRQSGFKSAEIIKDLQGKDRFARAVK